MNAVPASGDLSVQQAAHPPLPESFLKHLGNLGKWRQLSTALEETKRNWGCGRSIHGYSRSVLSSFAKLKEDYDSVPGSTDVLIQDDKWEKPDLIWPDVPLSVHMMQGFLSPDAQGHGASVPPLSRIFVLRPNSELPNFQPGDGDLFGGWADEVADDSEGSVDSDEEIEEIQPSHANDPHNYEHYRMIMVEKSISGNAEVKVEWASELIDCQDIDGQDIISPDSYDSWTAYRITSGKSELFLTANSDGRRTYCILDKAGHVMVNFATGLLPTLTAPYEVPEQWGFIQVCSNRIIGWWRVNSRSCKQSLATLHARLSL